MPTTDPQTTDPLQQGYDGDTGMTIAVENFGPIAEGKVELRPLTVFAGPSNTGKTWMASLIYTLYNYCHDAFSVPWLGRDFMAADLHRNKLNQPVFANIDRLINAIENGKTFELEDTDIEYLKQTIELTAPLAIRQLLRCYGVKQISNLIRRGYWGSSSISFKIGEIGLNLNLGSQQKNNSKFTGTLFDKMTSNDTIEVNLPEKNKISPITIDSNLFFDINNPFKLYSGKLSRSEEEEIQSKLQSVLYQYIVNMLADDLIKSVYYLPSDRGGIMNSQTFLISAMVRDQGNISYGTNSKRASLSGVTRDFLAELVGMLNTDSQVSGHTLPERLEKSILQGQVMMKESVAGFPLFYYRPDGWGVEGDLVMTHASSMVSELSPVVLYLRYLVRPGDIFIIDEPEAHLHPAAQEQFMNEIATWVKAGVQVILTTHSEWILDSLAYIVARGEWEEADEYKEVYLDKEDVGVWLFDHNDQDDLNKGSYIKEIIWEPGNAGYETGYFEILKSIHHKWAKAIDDQGSRE